MKTPATDEAPKSTSLIVNCTNDDDSRFVKVANSDLSEKDLQFIADLENLINDYRNGN